MAGSKSNARHSLTATPVQSQSNRVCRAPSVMELRHLRYFIVVAEYGNVRVASSHLHISQPAISRQIHDLDKTLGLQLFDRTARGLRLPRAGERYLLEVLRPLALIEAAGRSSRRGMEGRRGENGQ